MPERKIKFKWIETYHCGCTEEARRKKDLPGYCAKHGKDRREIYKVPVDPKEFNKFLK